MDMPPSRYKVVEKGRRLVVIDRLTGETVRHQAPHSPPPPRALAPPRGTGDIEPLRTEMRAPEPIPRGKPIGSGRVFTTADWYDNRAPRRLELSDDALSTLMFVGGALFCVGLLLVFFTSFVGFFVVAVVLGQKDVRAALRRSTTSWLDRLSPA